jgi:hypothetical protein
MNDSQKTENRVERVNLDDLRRLRDEALLAGPGSGRWIRCAQVLMDSFPAYYATAQDMNERLKAAGSELARMKTVVDEALEWSAERPVSDWADAALLKVLATFEGDRTEPCEGCDGECGEPCQPCTVTEMHAGIDRQTAALVEAGKLLQGTPLDAIYAEADRLGCRLPSGDSPEGYGITLGLRNLRTEGLSHDR